MDMADIQKGNIKVDIVRNLEQLKKAFNLRRQSFVKEKGIPENMEFDGNDFSCTHLLLCVNDEPAGTLRIRYFKDFPKIERLCIDEKFRGQHLPKYLLDYTEEYLSQKGYVYFFSYILKDLKDYWLTQGFQPDPNGQEVKEGNLSLLPVIYPFKKEKPSLKTISLLSREGNIKSY